MAKLFFRYGAMNGGKSTMIIQNAYNYQETGMIPILMKPKDDTKGDNKVCSRVGISRDVDYLIEKEDNLYLVIAEKYIYADCILIDEAQFLKREQVDQLMYVATKLNIPVICYGIRTDFLTNGFEGSTRLLEIAHSQEEIKTVCFCGCGKKAIFNARYVDGEFVVDGEQIEIDNNKKVTYLPMCAEHYYEAAEKCKDHPVMQKIMKKRMR